jgi:hypothetical protein
MVASNSGGIAAYAGKWLAKNSNGRIYFQYRAAAGSYNNLIELYTNAMVVSGDITATSFIKSGGTSSQFLKANGSIDSNSYITASSLTGLVPYTGATTNVDLGSARTMTAGAFYESSDIRFKNVLETNPSIDLPLDVIKFTRTDENSDAIRYGYSAQQVQSYLPDAVSGDEKLSVNYMDLHTLKIAALEKRIAELEAKLK